MNPKEAVKVLERHIEYHQIHSPNSEVDQALHYAIHCCKVVEGIKEDLKYLTTFQCDTPEACGKGAICNSCWSRKMAEDWLKKVAAQTIVPELKGGGMMTDQELKEAIKHIEFKVKCGMFSEKHSKVIKTLAEQYLAVQAKMPRRKEHIALLKNEIDFKTGNLVEGRTVKDWIKYGYNQALHEATLAVMKMCNVEKIENCFLELAGKVSEWEKFVTLPDIRIESVRKWLAHAIHKAIVGGENDP